MRLLQLKSISPCLLGGEKKFNFLCLRYLHRSKGKTITYTLDDTTAYEDFYGEPPKKPFKVRGSKLGYAFDVAEIEQTFLEKNGVQISVSEPIVAPESIKNDLPIEEEKKLKIDSDASDKEDKIIEIDTDISDKETEPEADLRTVIMNIIEYIT